MKLYIASILVALLATVGAQDEKKLPTESQDLINRLADWELEKQAALQAEMKAKRAEVVAVLQRHLAHATKSGDLDGALAIRQKITELTPQPTKSVEQPQPPTPEPPKDSKRFRGSRYAFVNERVDWNTAVERCKAMGGHLVCVETEREWEFLKEFYIDQLDGEKAYPYWLGIERPKGQAVPHKWLDGTAVEFKAWGSGATLDELTKDTARAHYPGAFWVPVQKTNNYPFICEWSE